MSGGNEKNNLFTEPFLYLCLETDFGCELNVKTHFGEFKLL